jgi:cyclic dehypoxanthinyl futalosine synthase
MSTKMREVSPELAPMDRGEVAEYSALYDRPLLELGALAAARGREAAPGDEISYIVDRNINYTNVCVTDCSFCAFYRRPGHEEGYVLTPEQIGTKIDEAKAIGAVQILMQGGHNPYLKLNYYTELLDFIKRYHPIHVHGFSASELDIIARVHKMDVGAVISELKDAGLDSVPGAGAEILVDGVRDRIARKKIDTARWLEIHREVHARGLLSSATMMFGAGESRRDRVEHMIRVRDLQSETGGFTAFIPWTLQADGTEMDGTPEVSAAEYLKTVAISRIVIDNVRNLQVSYVTQGPKVAQVALHFGCNDFGSVMMEENVVSAAGTAPISGLHDGTSGSGLVLRVPGVPGEEGRLMGGRVLVMMGSESDRAVMQKGVDVLAEAGVDTEVVVSSAHRDPVRTADIAGSAEENGFAVVICGAGLSAALPGVVAAHTQLPVIGVPISAGTLGGMDSLLSIAQMPPGVPVAAVGIDNSRNAAYLALRLLRGKRGA